MTFITTTDFQMFTPEGNVTAANVMANFIDSLTTRPAQSEDEAYARLAVLLEAAAKTHEEIYDTEVRYAMADLLAPIWPERFGAAVDQWRIG